MSLQIHPVKKHRKYVMKPKKARREDTCAICSSTSKGLFLGFVSGFIFSWTTMIVQYLKDIHPGQLTAYRYLGISCFILPQLVSSHENPIGHPGSRLAILLLSISSAGTNFLLFIASRYLPLGEAAALTSCNPAFITFVGRVFLKESLGIVQVIALMATTVGIILITGVYQMFNNSRIYTPENLYGFAAALGSLLVSTIHMSLTRKLASGTVHYSVILFTSGIVGLVVSLVLTRLMSDFRLCRCGLEMSFVILLGVLSYLALLTLTMSAKYVDAGPMSTMRAASDIFFSFAWQATIFSDIPNGVTIFGAVLTCTAIALIGFSRQINAHLPQKYVNLC